MLIASPSTLRLPMPADLPRPIVPTGTPPALEVGVAPEMVPDRQPSSTDGPDSPSESPRGGVPKQAGVALLGVLLLLLAGMVLKRSWAVTAITVTATESVDERLDLVVDPATLASQTTEGARRFTRDQLDNANRARGAAVEEVSGWIDRFRSDGERPDGEQPDGGSDESTDAAEADLAAAQAEFDAARADMAAAIADEANEFGAPTGASLPDYELRIGTGKAGWFGSRDLRSLGVRVNQSAADGLTWSVAPPISTAEIGLVSLADVDDLKIDEQLAELSLRDFDTLHAGYRFEAATEFSPLVGLESFLTSPLGLVIVFSIVAVLLGPVVGVIGG